MQDRSISDIIAGLFDQLKTYFRLQVEYFKLSLGERFIWFFSSLITRVILIWTFILVMLFSSLAFVFWFGNKTGNLPLGFLIAAGFYLILGLLVFFLRRPLIIDPMSRFYYHLLELNKKDKKDEV
jgi:hypothetical protein